MRKKIGFLILIIIIVVGFFVWRYRHSSVVLQTYGIDVLINNAQVVTLDGQSRIYNPGWIAIKDGKILALGQGKEAPKNYYSQKVIDAQGKIAMPGLVNTHSHAAMAMLTGLGQNLPLHPWLEAM